MVQELHVLKCFSCDTFQSHIVKKTNKWECKICGSKQSIKKVYGRGSGKDCRIHTQKLNALKGEKEVSKHIWKSDEEPISENNKPQYSYIREEEELPRSNKWAEYLNENEVSNKKNEQEIVSPVCENTMKIERAPKRKRTFKMYETSSLEEEIGFEDYDSLKYFDSEPHFVDSPSNLKKGKHKKYNRCLSKNQISDIICAFQSPNQDDEAEVKSQSLKLKAPPRQNVPATVSLKWAKYLDEPNQEDDNPNISQNSTVSPIVGELIEKCDTIKNSDFGRLDISSPEGDENYSNKKTIIGSVSNLNVLKNQQYLNNLAKKPNVAFVDGSFSNHLNNQHRPGESIMQSTKPLPIFEQNCDLSDSDLKLDF